MIVWCLPFEIIISLMEMASFFRNIFNLSIGVKKRCSVCAIIILFDYLMIKLCQIVSFFTAGIILDKIMR